MIDPMAKIEVVGPLPLLGEVVDYLHASGCLHVIEEQPALFIPDGKVLCNGQIAHQAFLQSIRGQKCQALCGKMVVIPPGHILSLKVDGTAPGPGQAGGCTQKDGLAAALQACQSHDFSGPGLEAAIPKSAAAALGADTLQ